MVECLIALQIYEKTFLMIIRKSFFPHTKYKSKGYLMQVLNRRNLIEQADCMYIVSFLIIFEYQVPL